MNHYSKLCEEDETVLHELTPMSMVMCFPPVPVMGEKHDERDTTALSNKSSS